MKNLTLLKEREMKNPFPTNYASLEKLKHMFIEHMPMDMCWTHTIYSWKPKYFSTNNIHLLNLKDMIIHKLSKDYVKTWEFMTTKREDLFT